MSGIGDILAGYESLRAGQEAFYLDLRQHPELSHAEHRTARRVADQLRNAGFTITSGIGGTGVAGVLANGSGPAVLLRCELDALPLREATGAPYASMPPPATPAARRCPSIMPAATTCTWPA
jgi:metal-dependent amidase/aminoacylase/carboxypeptidase family protein